MDHQTHVKWKQRFIRFAFVFCLFVCFTVLNCNNCVIVKAEELCLLSLVSMFELFNTILIKLITGEEIESISDCELNVSFDITSFDSFF